MADRNFLIPIKAVSVEVTGQPGAVVASRYVGSTNTGAAPASGTFLTGDWITTIVAGIASIFVCTAGGTQGTWSQVAATPQNRLAFDTLWAAAGDLVIGTGADTATILPASTVAGRALVANPHLTNKVSWGDPLDVENTQAVTGSALTATYNRLYVPSSVTAFTPTSATLYLFGIALPEGITVANLTVWAGTTAGATLTHSWMGISNSSRVQKAISADNTTAAWTASTSRTFAMTTPYQTVGAALHYLWLCIVGTTIPTIEAATGLAATGARNTAPRAGGAADTGQTTPGAAPSTAANPTTGTALPYIEVS